MIATLLKLMIGTMTLAAPAPNHPVEPMSPESMCDRFIKPSAQKDCVKKAKTMDLDWYAASVCNLVDSDDSFLKCWNNIDGKVFSPADLTECADPETTDDARLLCMKKVSKVDPNKAKGGKARMPASAYQKKNK